MYQKRSFQTYQLLSENIYQSRIVDLFLLLDHETQLLNQENLQTLNRLAASQNPDLQMTAAVYYLHLSHHRE